MCRLEERVVELNGASSHLGCRDLHVVSIFGDTGTRARRPAPKNSHPDILQTNTQPDARRSAAWLPGPPSGGRHVLRSGRPQLVFTGPYRWHVHPMVARHAQSGHGRSAGPRRCEHAGRLRPRHSAPPLESYRPRHSLPRGLFRSGRWQTLPKMLGGLRSRA